MAATAPPTRRLVIIMERLESDALQGDLFNTFSTYGLVEWLSCEEDPNYNDSAVTVQFNKVSSAEQLLKDVSDRGNPWRVECSPPVPCIASQLLLGSLELLDAALLRKLVPGFDFVDIGTLAKYQSPSARMATFEEKTIRVPGRSVGNQTTVITAYNRGAGGTTEQETALWDLFKRSSKTVSLSCIGSYAVILRFVSPHDANTFLSKNQHHLASKGRIYAMHIGVPSESELAQALPLMLTRRCLTAATANGGILRGYVVGAPSGSHCIVDAGVYPSSEHPSSVLLVKTHTNFLSVSLGDEVEIRLSAPGTLGTGGPGLAATAEAENTPRVAPSTGLLTAKLMRVASTAAALVRKANAAARTLPSSGGNGGRGGPDISTILQRVKANERRGGNVAPVAAGSAAAKTLASKLFESIQKKKAVTGSGNQTGGTDGSGSGAAAAPGGAAERLCAYPDGLHLYARLLVRIDYVGEDGLYASCIKEANNPGSASYADGVVFVPSSLVPAEGGGENGWKSFAVAGERMHVALLYMVAVGGSAATMRAVASKLEFDLRRCTTGPAHPSGAEQRITGADNAARTAPAPGTPLSATCLLELRPGDLGVGEEDTSTFPAYMVRPAAPSSPVTQQLLSDLPSGVARVECQMPLLLPARYVASACDGDGDSGVGVSNVSSLAAIEAVVSDVVSDARRGYYILLLPADVYASRQAQLVEAEQRKKTSQLDEVKRRLVAAMGEGILSALQDDGNEEIKRPRVE